MKTETLHEIAHLSARILLLAGLLTLSGRLPIVRDGTLTPERVRVLWENCRSYQREGSAEKVLDSVSPLLEAFPENPIYLSVAGENYTQLGRHAEAAKIWEKYLLVAPRPIEGCPQLGQAYAAQNLADQALDAHRRCLALDPTKTDSMLYVALALEHRRSLTEAEGLYRQILAKSPDYGDARLGLARVLLFEKKMKEAKGLAEACVRHMPQNPDALLVGALLAEQEGTPQKGIEYLEKAIRISPTYEDLKLVLARLQRQRGATR